MLSGFVSEGATGRDGATFNASDDERASARTKERNIVIVGGSELSEP